jgi:hypothetical protein
MTSTPSADAFGHVPTPDERRLVTEVMNAYYARDPATIERLLSQHFAADRAAQKATANDQTDNGGAKHHPV